MAAPVKGKAKPPQPPRYESTIREFFPEAEPEHYFSSFRKWRTDWVLCHKRQVGIEVHGGIYIRGRHQRPAGFKADMEKANAARMLGWTIFESGPDTLGETLAGIKRWMDEGMSPELERELYPTPSQKRKG